MLFRSSGTPLVLGPLGPLAQLTQTQTILAIFQGANSQAFVPEPALGQRMDAQKDPIYMGNDGQPLDVDGFWRFLLVIPVIPCCPVSPSFTQIISSDLWNLTDQLL